MSVVALSTSKQPPSWHNMPVIIDTENMLLAAAHVLLLRWAPASSPFARPLLCHMLLCAHAETCRLLL
jgi:hypothetical protein